MVEAWGFRAMQSRGDRSTAGRTRVLWLETEYRPVVAMLHEAGLVGDRTDAEAYMRDRRRALSAAAHARVERRGPPAGASKARDAGADPAR